MINPKEIERKWLSIDVKDITGFRYIRLDKNSKPEFNIGFNSDGFRCIILELPKDFSFDFNSVKKENLSIRNIKKENYIVIELLNIEYNDLFNDLLVSLYQKINDITHAQDYSNEFVLTFGKWIEFFENDRKNQLSEEQIQGLFGELFILNEYLKKSKPSAISSLLSSWKGLYDSANDFEFNLKNVEVKTKKDSVLFVKISSEYQLEKELDKSLELLVVSVKIDLINGRSIFDMLLEIIKLLRETLSDLSILYQALNQKGLTVENLKQYNNHRFIVTKTESFNAGHDGFPKLSISNIDSEISNLKYKLRVTQLNEYLIEMKKY
ncbi:PD-(D/E)XK motif protein [Winogradskyella sp. PE311]|uniref:PD-(D/E)XK motif protein n=1 Tax=Winogradskyella sp. PE311 TaxID=3366943 RepID=UPI0039804E82